MVLRPSRWPSPRRLPNKQARELGTIRPEVRGRLHRQRKVVAAPPSRNALRCRCRSKLSFTFACSSGVSLHAPTSRLTSTHTAPSVQPTWTSIDSSRPWSTWSRLLQAYGPDETGHVSWMSPGCPLEFQCEPSGMSYRCLMHVLSMSPRCLMDVSSRGQCESILRKMSHRPMSPDQPDFHSNQRSTYREQTEAPWL